jgi:hypothetical protein
LGVDITLESPYAITLYVINLNGGRGNDAKVVTGALQGPEQLRLGSIRRDNPEFSISGDNFQRDKVVCDEAITSLQVAVASA